MAATPVWSIDPRTGAQRERVADEADARTVDVVVRAAHGVRGVLADRVVRAGFLRSAAGA
ncbi:aldehyde dehydrogenase (NADP(+)), partial [Streptomyces sp. NPDC006274]